MNSGSSAPRPVRDARAEGSGQPGEAGTLEHTLPVAAIVTAPYAKSRADVIVHQILENLIRNDEHVASRLERA